MPSKSNIKISLCIPNYNRAEDLLVVVEDCKHQTVAPYEIIIQDDKSSPDQLKIIKKKLKLTKNMKFYTSNVNRGLAGNTNYVIKRARGDYMAIINNDDRVSKYYVEELIKAIQKYPGYNVYTTNGMAINDDGIVIGDYRANRGDKVFKKGEAIRTFWRKNMFNMITISGTTFYKTSFIKKNLFVEKYRNEADLNNGIKFLTEEKVVYIDKPIYFVRMHPDQESFKNKLNEKRINEYISNCVSIYEKYAKKNARVPLYLEKVKAVYFLQLFLKYRYDLSHIKKLMNVTSAGSLAFLAFLSPWYVIDWYRKKALFPLHRNGYQKFAPPVRG